MALPLHELELLRRWGNHAEFARKLQELALTSDLGKFDDLVRAVGSAWFLLGREHLKEARSVLVAGAQRAAYSRAYYAAYNFSKSVRFMVSGWVSLKGDDHQAVGKLPADFPNTSRWGSELELLYEHRLRADYDNWTDSASKYTKTAQACVESAANFEIEAVGYLSNKIGFDP